jgi:hypothetical protein
MTKQSIFALTVQAGADFQALSISSKQCKPTAGTSYQIERSHESDLLAVPLVAGSEASAGAAAVLLAAGVAAVLLAAGAAADCPVGRLLKEGQTMPTSMTLTKY